MARFFGGRPAPVADPSPDRFRGLGDEARDRRDWTAAAEHYAEHLKTHPDDGAIWVQHGHARKEAGDLAGAERSYLRALSLDPANADTEVQLGHVEKLKGYSDQALARYRKALVLDPTFGPAIEEVRAAEEAAAAAAQEARAREQEAASALDAQIDRAIDRRLDQFTRQVEAIRALALELNRIRRRMETLDTGFATLTARVDAIEAGLGETSDDHAGRIAALEAQAPIGTARFPSLLALVGEAAGRRDDLDQLRARLDALDRRIAAITSEPTGDPASVD